MRKMSGDNDGDGQQKCLNTVMQNVSNWTAN